MPKPHDVRRKHVLAKRDRAQRWTQEEAPTTPAASSVQFGSQQLMRQRSIFRGPFDLGDNVLENLQAPLLKKSYNNVTMFGFVLVTHLTSNSLRWIAKRNPAGFNLAAAEKLATELPFRLPINLGEAAILGATEPGDIGMRFVGYRLDYESGLVLKDERRRMIAAIGGTGLVRPGEASATVLATEDYATAVDARDTLNASIEPEAESQKVILGPVQVVR